MKSDIEKNIDFFFKNPKEFSEPYGRFSILYLLRRDINTCLSSESLAKWPGAMAIFAGIDLLGKFLEGSDDFDKGKAGRRFKKFLKLYFQLNTNDQEIIYQLRNALLHSFGLYSRAKQKKKYKKCKQDKEYKFTLIERGKQLILHSGDDSYLINIQLLHRQFEKAIDKYWQELKEDDQLKNNFNQMFDRYAVIYIGEIRK